MTYANITKKKIKNPSYANITKKYIPNSVEFKKSLNQLEAMNNIDKPKQSKRKKRKVKENVN